MLRRHEEGNGHTGISAFEAGAMPPAAEDPPIGMRRPPLPVSSRELMGRTSPSSDGSPRPRHSRMRKLTTLQMLCLAVLTLAACAGVRWLSEVRPPDGDQRLLRRERSQLLLPGRVALGPLVTEVCKPDPGRCYVMCRLVGKVSTPPLTGLSRCLNQLETFRIDLFLTLSPMARLLHGQLLRSLTLGTTAAVARPTTLMRAPSQKPLMRQHRLEHANTTACH